MKKFAFLLVCLLSCPVFSQVRLPFIRVPEKQKQMELQDLDIKIDIMGNIATTTYEMTFFNPNERILEGEIIFPLTPNQSVIQMALDINGKMRMASAVDKEKARQVFEDQVRRGVDPALVEKVSGNQYRMRIYPFNPKGTRRVQIMMQENLEIKKNEMEVLVPLKYNKKLKTFGIKVNVAQKESALPKVMTDLVDFIFQKKDQHVFASYKKKDYLLKNSLRFVLPAPPQEVVYTGQEGNKNYFYGTIQVKEPPQDKALPKKIAVVWDTSFSGQKRLLQKEQEVLKKYLSHLKEAEVELISFNIHASPVQKFEVKEGQADALLKALSSLTYDGATNFESVHWTKLKADEILLFSDGVATLGDAGPVVGQVPVYVIGSAEVNEKKKLAHGADQTFGRYIDLRQLTPEAAVAQLLQRPVRLVGYKMPKGVREVYPLPPVMGTQNFSFAGIYDGKETEIGLQFGYEAKKVAFVKKVKIAANQKNALVPRQWATYKLQQLELDAPRHRQEIIQLGKEFSLLTEYTSLLVLDSLSDYLRYRVAPKEADLLKEYNHYLAKEIQKEKYQDKKEKKRAMVDTLRMVREIKKWWQKEFKQVPPTLSDESPYFMKDPQEIDKENGIQANESGKVVMSFAAAPRASMDVSMRANVSTMGKMYKQTEAEALLSDGRTAEEKNAKIKLKEWAPNLPYLKELRKEKEPYAAYLKLRDKYGDRPAFYFDVAEELTRREMTDQAVLVITNLLELQTDNVELFKVVAQKLQSMKQDKMAETLFKKIIEMYPDEPQGYRDLALFYEFSGQYQKALAEQVFILSKKWASWNGVKREVLIDMSGLIAAHKNLDLKKVNPALIMKIPMDLRLVLGGSSRENALWLEVENPFHQDLSYGTDDNGARLTKENGNLGPESYRVKKAIEGTYHIKVPSFYGEEEPGVLLPPFAWLDVYTYFGQKNQTHDRNLVRLDELQNNSLGTVSFPFTECTDKKPLSYFGQCLDCEDDRKLFMKNDTCAKCPNREMLGAFCVKACVAEKPMRSQVGNCYECTHPKALFLSKKECDKCPNREMKFGYCVLSEYRCPKDRPLREGVMTCQKCDNEKSMIVSAEDCAKCPNREMVGKYCALKQCPANKPLQLADGVCSDCNVATAEVVSAENCAQCPNREMVGKYCVRKECAAEAPVQDEDGACHRCEEESSINLSDKTQCDKCSNRSLFDDQCRLNCTEKAPLQDEAGDCYSCDEETVVYTTKEMCARCKNRGYDEEGFCFKKTCANEKDIEGKGGQCLACESEEAIRADKEECDKCPQRKMVGDFCVLSCLKKNQMQDVDGNCYDCDTVHAIFSDAENCQKCPHRVWKGGKCVLPCPKEKPLMGQNGTCYSCEEESPIPTDTQECQKCPNRKQYGAFCRGKCDEFEPMQDNQGRCYDCDEERGLEIPLSECRKCSNREMVGYGCYEKCPDYAPLVDQDGNCYTCDLDQEKVRHHYNGGGQEMTPAMLSGDQFIAVKGPEKAAHLWNKNQAVEYYSVAAVKTSKENCRKCPNLTYKDGFCIAEVPQGTFMLTLKEKK